MFEIAVDRSSRLLRVKVWGFWTVGIVEDFFEREQAAARSLGGIPGSYRLVVDLREMKIQSREVVDSVRNKVSAAEHGAARIALLVSPGLIRAQVQRALADRAFRMFETEREALAYVLDGGIDAG